MREALTTLACLASLVASSTGCGGDAIHEGDEGDASQTTSRDGSASDDASPDTSIAGDGSAPSDDATAPTEGGTDIPFRHPGVLVNADQLAFVKAKIAANAAPWAAAFTAAQNDSAGSLAYKASPPTDTVCATGGPGHVGDVACGSGSNPDCHCNDEKRDAVAAYTHALLYALGGDEAHAKKSIEIMNAWSASMKSHSLSNAVLQSGWVGTMWPRAGEIIRAMYPGWANADIEQFKTMLKTAYLPNTIHGAAKENGNWEFSAVDGTIQMAVFLDDRASFDAALPLWRRRVPAYIYMKTDGKPVVVPGTGSLEASWNNASTFFDGLCEETCRDLGHVQYGFAAMINGAETARIQGVDLYQEEAPRIVAGLELAAGYVLDKVTTSPACAIVNGTIPTWEIARNEYVTRLGMALPNTTKLVMKLRPTGEEGHHMAWETLTHAEVGAIGLP